MIIYIRKLCYITVSSSAQYRKKDHHCQTFMVPGSCCGIKLCFDINILTKESMKYPFSHCKIKSDYVAPFIAVFWQITERIKGR